MARKTIHDRLVDALITRGERVIGHRSSRYTVLTNGGTDKFFYIGRAGALRAGRTIAGSTPVSAKYRAMLLKQPGQEQ